MIYYYYVLIIIKNMKKYIISSIWLLFLFTNNARAAINYWWQDSVDPGIIWTEETLDSAVQTLIRNFSIFLSLIAVIFWLRWGFMIMTAWIKEDNVKKWKTIIMYSLIGLVVIWLAYSIVYFVITKILVS